MTLKQRLANVLRAVVLCVIIFLAVTEALLYYKVDQYTASIIMAFLSGMLIDRVIAYEPKKEETKDVWK